MTTRSKIYFRIKKALKEAALENKRLTEAANAIADWWADKMQRPLNQNNGMENEKNGDMAFLLMNSVSMEAQKSLTPENIKEFKKYLVEFIVRDPYLYYNTDYNPGPELADAARLSGINELCFPYKSMTTLDCKTYEVWASYGYRAENVKIYPVERKPIFTEEEPNKEPLTEREINDLQSSGRVVFNDDTNDGVL